VIVRSVPGLSARFGMRVARLVRRHGLICRKIRWSSYREGDAESAYVAGIRRERAYDSALARNRPYDAV
jgi:hypothetical protein